MTIEELTGEKLGVCVSGGLDSRTVAKRCVEAGLETLCFTADLGQPDEDDIGAVTEKMAPCGVKTVIVDLKREMAEACFAVLRSRGRYDGGYWNSTGIARAVTVRGLLTEMKKRGCTVLAHGATGRGNDQMRFERYTNVLAPDMKVYAPWRDPVLLKEFPGRKQMAEYLNSAGIETFAGDNALYSTDANLAGISYEGENLESLETPATIVEPRMGVWPANAPDKGEEVTIRLKQGRPVEICGKEMNALDVMIKANEIAGRNGVGIRNVVENRIIGTKSRGVYESPGMELLGFCVDCVYQAVMDRRAGELFAALSALVGKQIYDGRFYDPAPRAALAAVDVLSRPASGTVKVRLYKGNIEFLSLTDCPGSLYNPADASMEESEGLNPESSRGYAEVQRVEALALARAGQIE
ncbi:MAG: argininosuccinate synthase [Kiritimatiellia bacterium]